MSITPGRVLEAVKSALAACPELWEEINFLDLLHHVGDQIHIPTGVFMKTMRHALTGLKVRYPPACPSFTSAHMMGWCRRAQLWQTSYGC